MNTTQQGFNGFGGQNAGQAFNGFGGQQTTGTARRARREDLGVQPGQQIAVKGTTLYTRNAVQKLEGAALDSYNKKILAKNSNRLPQKPAFMLTLINPEFSDPNAPLAQYYMQHQYSVDEGMAINFENLGNFAPAVYEYGENGTDIVPVEGATHIPQNIEVTIIVEAYKGKNAPNLSSAFVGIICPHGTSYVNTYSSGLSTNSLAALGFNVVGSPIRVEQQASMPSVQDIQAQATGTFGAQPTQPTANAFNANANGFQQAQTTPQPSMFVQPQQQEVPQTSMFTQPEQPAQQAQQTQQATNPFGTNPFGGMNTNPFGGQNGQSPFMNN